MLTIIPSEVHTLTQKVKCDVIMWNESEVNGDMLLVSDYCHTSKLIDFLSVNHT